MKRLLSWLVIGGATFFLPVAVRWFYRVSISLLNAFANASPLLYSVFSFLSDLLEESVVGVGVVGLLASVLVYGLFHLSSLWSLALSYSLGGRYLLFGSLSLAGVLRDFVHMIQELSKVQTGSWNWKTGYTFQYAADSAYWRVFALALFAQFVYSILLLNAFSDVGSLKLLFGGKARTVFLAVPKDAHEKFRVYAFVADKSGVMSGDGTIDQDKLIRFLRRLRNDVPEARENDLFVCCGKIVMKDLAKFHDLFQVHIEPGTGEIFYNRNTPLCELLRMSFRSDKKELSSLGYVSLKEVKELPAV